MESNNVEMQEKMTEMQVEATELKLKDFQIEEKVTQLEARNRQLEIKVHEQETILTSLLLETKKCKSATGSKSNLNNLETAIQSKSGTPRTCRELQAADPSLSSGMQWIDPDGEGVGDSPIYVYCDMSTGK